MSAPLFQVLTELGAVSLPSPQLVSAVERARKQHKVSSSRAVIDLSLAEVPQALDDLRLVEADRGMIVKEIQRLELEEKRLAKAAKGKWILLAVLVVIVFMVFIGQAL